MKKQLQKRKEREEKQSVREKKRNEREQKNEGVSTRSKGVLKKTNERKKTGNLRPVGSSSEAESDTVCPKCGLVYSDSGGLWVCCDRCNRWFDVKCSGIKRRNVPEFYYCEDCV